MISRGCAQIRTCLRQAAPRLHEFDSYVHEFDERPDYLLRVKGDSVELAKFVASHVAS